jgi:hypothetical protein
LFLQTRALLMTGKSGESLTTMILKVLDLMASG